MSKVADLHKDILELNVVVNNLRRTIAETEHALTKRYLREALLYTKKQLAETQETYSKAIEV